MGGGLQVLPVSKGIYHFLYYYHGPIFRAWSCALSILMAFLGGAVTSSPILHPHVLEFAQGLVPVFAWPDIPVLVAEYTGNKTTASTSNRVYTYFSSYYCTNFPHVCRIYTHAEKSLSVSFDLENI